MKAEIDQSGKIEQTNLDTVIALSNDIQIAIVIPRKVKRKLLILFRDNKKEKLFPQMIFALGIAYILRFYPYKYKITIDSEYTGHEGIITKWIIIFFKNLCKKKTPYIVFGFIGKSSPADKYCRKIVEKKEKPTQILTYEEIINTLKL